MRWITGSEHRHVQQVARLDVVIDDDTVFVSTSCAL